MKFKILTEYTNYLNEIIYSKQDYYFIGRSHIEDFNFGISFDGIEIIFDDNNKLIEIVGYSNYRKWVKKKKLDIPTSYIEGSLLCVDNFEAGFTYQSPTYGNSLIFYDKNYICISVSSNKATKGVKCMSNCICFLDDETELVSIWLVI